MKIIIIPSAQSLPFNDFSTILSKSGLDCADTLASVVNDINPDIVYCSPFIRAIQTIYPYCIQHDKNIKVECSLSPLKRFDSKFEYCTHSLRSYKDSFPYLFEIFDVSYQTTILSNNITRNETRDDICNRLYPFLYQLKREFGEKNITIVLVTHSDISPFIVQYLKDISVVVLDNSCVSSNEETLCCEG